MSVVFSREVKCKFVSIIATSVLRLLLSTCPAAAQADQSMMPSSSMTAVAGPESLIVTAHPSIGRSSIGAPIHDVDMSQAVRADDLNLHTGSGILVLRQRVKDTARDLCDMMVFRYPVGTPDQTTCYKTTVSDAQPQVDTAIQEYRSPNPYQSENP
jgi:UrcA family protein